jgi:excisionase family DNA binding protein
MTNKGAAPTPMLTIDVARRLGCSTDNVRKLERAGQLPAAKSDGGVRIFDRADVEQFARAREDRNTRSGRR